MARAASASQCASEQIDRTSTGCVLLSTIADEALDIPRLDRLIMPYPTANTALVQQRIGRIARPHPNKKDAVVYDICDGLVSVLKKQFQKRAQYYHKMGYKVEFVDRPSV
jgi:superfamily II DNA or RNA helicase